MYGQGAAEDRRDVGEVEEIEHVEIDAHTSGIAIEGDGNPLVRHVDESPLETGIERPSRALVGYDVALDGLGCRANQAGGDQGGQAAENGMTLKGRAMMRHGASPLGRCARRSTDPPTGARVVPGGLATEGSQPPAGSGCMSLAGSAPKQGVQLEAVRLSQFAVANHAMRQMTRNECSGDALCTTMRLTPLLVATLALAACQRPSSPQQFNGHTMGTTYSVTATRLPDTVDRAALQSAIDSVLADVNEHLSTYDPASEISAFNASRATTPTAVSQDFAAVVKIANDVSTVSSGAFDITVGPLVRAWGFGEDAPGASAPADPDPGLIAQLRAEVGFDKLILAADGRWLRKAVPTLQLDVNGIAPGYAVDLIAERFEAFGVRDFLIELGGEIRAHGRSPSGRPWRVAVEAPLSGERKPYALVEVDGVGVSTSGDYRDFRLEGTRRLSHTIDPRTGAPVTHRLASVCVVHPSTAYADAYATALMVLGPDEGMALATKLKLPALFIERTADASGFTERSTPEFARLRRPLD
ncbi:MAG: FAD:protein FMN transferase [Gammaproteobacteria bacterium]|nr:FAD:protein FMN transferase [Gammaproteobacteria bacterium]